MSTMNLSFVENSEFKHSFTFYFLSTDWTRRHALWRLDMGTDLRTTVGSFTHTKTNKGRVCHFHQDVIHTVHVDVGDSSPLHVLHNLICSQRSVKASIAIWAKLKGFWLHSASQCAII